MNELTEMLGAVGLKTHTMVLTLAGFKASEHESPKLVLEYGMNDKDFGLVLFFDGNCYIQEYENNADFPYMVQLSNSEYVFKTKDEAIKYLYHHHYLVECTELF